MTIDANIARIKFLRSETAGRTPSDFENGELAFNIADRTIFTKKVNGDVVELGFGKGGNVNGAINATGNVTAPTFIGKLQGNADSASKWTTPRKLTLSGDATGESTFDGSTNFTLNASVHTVYPRQNVMSFDETPGNMRQGFSIDWVGNVSGFPNYGTVITAKAYAAGGSAFQIYSPYSPSLGGDSLRYRTGVYSASPSWGDLKTIVDNNNIGRYAPSLTGVGASGDWNINSASANKLKTAVKINGTDFDGTSNITISEPTFTRFLSGLIVTDANSVDGVGVQFKFLSSSGVNKPVGFTDGPIMSMSYNNLWNFQIVGDHRTGVMYTRPKNNGTWGSWKTTLNNENIGDHALPISGGTLNGNLIVNGDVRSTGIIGSESTKGFGAGNNRTLKPVDMTAKTFAVNFSSLKGLNDPVADATYGDFLSLNTWSGSSGGKLNGLFFAKGTQRIKHYQAAHDATVWGTPLDIAYLTDNVASATKLETARTISITGRNASGSTTFDGSKNESIGLNVFGLEQPTKSQNDTVESLANNTFNIGMYPSTRPSDVNAKYGAQKIMSLGIDTWPTQLAFNGYKNEMSIRTRVSSGGAWNDWRELAFSDSDITGKSASATKLETARTIGITGGSGASGSVTFDGTGNALIPLSVVTQPTTANNLTIATTAFVQAVNSADTGSAATAVKLKTPRTINGTNFDGSANITTVNWGATRNFTIGGTTRGVNGASNLTWTLSDIGALGVGDNAVSATKLQTPKKINGVDFDGTKDIQINSVTGTLDVEGDINSTGKIKGDIVNKFGLYDKMFWVGSYRAMQAVAITVVDANTLQFDYDCDSGSKYLENGKTIFHFNYNVANGKFFNGTLKSFSPVAGGTLGTVNRCILDSPSHGITTGTNYWMIAITYESYGCSLNGWASYTGDARFQLKLKADINFNSRFPIISASSVAFDWWQSGATDAGVPIPHYRAATVCDAVAFDNQNIMFIVNDIGTNGSNAHNPVPSDYVTISVKDRA